MNRQELQSLIDRYLKGECSKREAQIIEEFIQSYRAKPHEPWNETLLGNKGELKEQLFQEINLKIKPDNLGEKSGKNISLNLWIKIAASVILIMGAAIMTYLSVPQFQDKEEIVWQIKKTEEAQRKAITLGDGTFIYLNAESSIEYPQEFAADKRTIRLAGEAYFDVAEDPDRPFEIKTEDLLTTVLGTKFNIRSYAGEEIAEVAVASGKVSVQKIGSNKQMASKKSTILLPKEKVVYSKNSQQTKKSNFDYMEVFAWKDKIIYFKNADIEEVLETLEQWYGVTFIRKRKINQDRDYTGNFRNKSLEVVLDGLSYVFDFEFEINEKVVVIK